MSENVKRVEWFADDLSQCEHYMQDQFGNVWVEIKDGATHMVATSEIQKLIEKSKDVFELTIKTIPHCDKDCLVTFNKIDKRMIKNGTT